MPTAKKASLFKGVARSVDQSPYPTNLANTQLAKLRAFAQSFGPLAQRIMVKQKMH